MQSVCMIGIQVGKLLPANTLLPAMRDWYYADKDGDTPAPTRSEPSPGGRSRAPGTVSMRASPEATPTLLAAKLAAGEARRRRERNFE
jgi:hypothetical protein